MGARATRGHEVGDDHEEDDQDAERQGDVLSPSHFDFAQRNPLHKMDTWKINWIRFSPAAVRCSSY